MTQKITGVVRGLGSQNSNLRAGLGYDPNDRAACSEIKAITNAVLQGQQEALTIKAVQQGLQGVWTKWKNVISRDISWKIYFPISIV